MGDFVMDRRGMGFIDLAVVACGNIVLFFCFALSATAQTAGEWNISLGAGGHSLRYGVEQGSTKLGLGGTLGVGYTAFFSRSVGLSFGLEADLYGSSLNIGSLSREYLIPTPPDLEGNFFLQSVYSGIEEKQHAVFLQVPLMLQFQQPVSKKSFFYLAAGAKAGFAVWQTWSQTVETLTTTGYSDYTRQPFSDMPNHGFETKTGSEESGNLKFDSPVMLALEVGFKWKTSNKNAIYTGVYVDYGLTDIVKPDAKKLIEYNSSDPANPIRNSVLQSELLNSSQGVKPFAVGVKLRIAFGRGEKKKRKMVPGPVLGQI